jgi:hypothetical protein
MLKSPDAWSVLTEDELLELGDLVKRWLLAHVMRDFQVSDELRIELMEWGAWPIEDGWHPVFESTAHRYARVMKRSELEDRPS